MGRELSARLSEAEMSNATKLKNEKQTKQVNLLPDESYLYAGGASGDNALKVKLTDAEGLLRTNPQAGIDLAKAIFAEQLPTTTLFFFWQLAGQHREASDQLFLWLLSRLRRDETAGAGPLHILASYAFGGEIILITDGLHGWAPTRGTPKGISKAREFASEGWIRQYFIDVSYVVLSRAANRDLSAFSDSQSRLGGAAHLAQWLEPRVAKLRPALLPAWQSMSVKLHERLSSIQQNSLARSSQSEDSIKERLAPNWKATNKEGAELVRELLEKAE
jgi:hypothetical protein